MPRCRFLASGLRIQGGAGREVTQSAYVPEETCRTLRVAIGTSSNLDLCLESCFFCADLGLLRMLLPRPPSQKSNNTAATRM